MSEEKDPHEMINEALSEEDSFDQLNEVLLAMEEAGILAMHDHERVDNFILKEVYADHPKAGECGSWSQLYWEIDESMQKEFLQNVGSAYLNR